MQYARERPHWLRHVIHMNGKSYRVVLIIKRRWYLWKKEAQEDMTCTREGQTQYVGAYRRNDNGLRCLMKCGP